MRSFPKHPTEDRQLEKNEVKCSTDLKIDFKSALSISKTFRAQHERFQ